MELYRQLKERLLEEVRSGRYGSDGRLPTEHELCELYGVSRTPVTRALSELADEGVVIRRRKLGTFVNPEWLNDTSLPELIVMGAGLPWAAQMRQAAGRRMRLDVRTPPLQELHDKFLKSVAEGNGPDLAVLDSVWVAEFARAGFLTPLNELDPDWVADEHDTDFLPPFAGAYRQGGDTMAVQAPADVTGLWYRRSALRRAGLAPPSTWEELHSLGRALAADRPPGGHVLVLPGGHAAAETTTYALVTLLAANGASVLSEGAVTLDSPATVETLRFLRRMLDDGVILPEVVNHTMDRPAQLFATGQADLCVGASYQAADLAEWAGVGLDRLYDEFGFVRMPRGPHGRSAVLCGGMAYTIPRQARHPELAMRLLKAAVATDALVALCLETGQLPPRRSALERISLVSPFHAETGARLEQAVLRPSSPVYALVSNRLQALVTEVLTRRLEPDAAVTRAADMISAITGLPQGS
ncbi:extracellular solute-binding protein [Nonomuraea dietziae]|uniref:extracellular solute-binding protein n=1 Tax=Nonomuraea dietziae TaxID=65515 RepID=UPI00342B91B8